MKIEKNVNIKTNSNLNNLQNNQRKEKFKRTMFGISNIRNLKKSSDILTVAGNESVIKIVENTTSASKLKSLDLVNKNIKQQQYIEQISNNTTIVTIKNVDTNETHFMRVNRYLATYSKIDNKYNVELKDNILKIPFSEFKNHRIKEAQTLYKKKEISEDQFLVILKRIKAIDLSYTHSIIMDIIEEDEEFLTIIYHIITTKNTVVDYGGPNQFDPVFLYYDDIKQKTFYTVPITYLQKVRRIDYSTYFLLKNEEAFKIDGIDLQRKLAVSLKKINEKYTFKLFNINKDCLNILPSDIDPKEILPDSKYSDCITGYINYLEKV